MSKFFIYIYERIFFTTLNNFFLFWTCLCLVHIGLICFFLRWIEANYNLPCIQKYVFKNQVSTNNSILLVLLARTIPTVQAGPATQHRPCKLPDQWNFQLNLSTSRHANMVVSLFFSLEPIWRRTLYSGPSINADPESHCTQCFLVNTNILHKALCRPTNHHSRFAFITFDYFITFRLACSHKKKLYCTIKCK